MAGDSRTRPFIEEQIELLVQARIAELLKSNEALRAEVRELRRHGEDLMARLDAAQAGRQADMCRPAVNVLEHAAQSYCAESRNHVECRYAEVELPETKRRNDEFLATLAHELRNPLAPIINSLYVLRLVDSDHQAAQQVLETIERQANHLVRLVDDLMEASRITRGRIDLRREKVDLASVIQTAIETSKPLIDAARHELRVQLPPEPLYVNADSVRLVQVLANLLNNAAKYTPERGTISLTVMPHASEVEITVRDTGIGISPEALPTVFDLFTRASGVTGCGQGGLGIGLTLARKLVEMHEGSIEARSAGTGQGSEFIVRLPLVVSFRPTHDIDEREDGRPADVRYRILVVDDNHDAATSLSMLLGMKGAEVHTVHDGPAALKALETYRPSFILLDLGMPGMDGFEVARRIRQQHQWQDVTLIALTGWGQDEDRRRSKAAGFDYHLVKPVDLRALEAVLSRLSESSHASGPRRSRAWDSVSDRGHAR